MAKDNAVIFIETRELPGLAEKQAEYMKWLPEWNHIAVCSWRNERVLTGEKVLIPDINSIPEYNKLCTDAGFWEMFEKYDRVLVCHLDTGILRHGIEDFLEWDYIGAPWPFQSFGGNGGFSLRNPRVMQEICRKWEYNASQGNEDIYFSSLMYHNGYNLAPREACSRFSVESAFVLGTVGYHFGSDSRLYLGEREKEIILMQYGR